MSDEVDYESFLQFCVDEQVPIPKLILTSGSEPLPVFDDQNTTMCVSWIRDSEMNPKNNPFRVEETPIHTARESARQLLDQQKSNTFDYSARA